jgi:hypothetical protein
MKGITLIFFHKENLGETEVINAASAFNTHLHRLESLCHHPKMHFASAYFGIRHNFLFLLKADCS